MSEQTPEEQDSAESSDTDDVAEPAAMKLDPVEVDHIELSEDGGESFEQKPRRGSGS